MIQSSSRQAYHTKSISQMTDQQRAIYDYLLEHGPTCDAVLMEELNMGANIVTPRRGELVTAGFVRSSGKKESPISHKDVIHWEIAKDEPVNLGIWQKVNEHWASEEKKAWEGSLFA